LRVPDIPQTVQPEATFNVTYEVANAGAEFTAYTLQTTAATPNITVENFSGDIEASNPDAEPPGASTTGIDSGDTALVTVEYRVAANAAGTAKINVTVIEPLSQAQANSSRVVSISEAPTNPRERALQAAGKAAPSELSQNDVTAIITRFERGQSVNGISVTQNDVTATITLFERSTESTEATATNTETRAKTYLSENGANLYSGKLADRTGQDEVTVSVGGGDNGFAFDKPGIVVSTGTTVIWEWTGEGGTHNIVSDDGSDYEFESELTDKTGYTIEQTVDETGVALYVCTPHRTLGMYGAVAVVDE
jgi:serine/threonine-protein kinase